MPTPKVLILRHMQEKRNDRVAQWMDSKGFEQHLVNPAHGIPLPASTDGYDAFVIYGGIQSANGHEEFPYIPGEIAMLKDWIAADRPVLGICLGAQLLAKALGGEVGRHPDGLFEVGFTKVSPHGNANGFLSESTYFYQWHGEGFTVPPNCELLAVGDTFRNQAFRYGERIYGVQFHPEVTHEIMLTWLASAESKGFQAPGAHPRERQVRDELSYGADMDSWCFSFLDRWRETW